MFYIQTYKKSNDPLKAHTASLSHIMDGDYMGSAEFEFGSVGRSYRYITSNEMMTVHKVLVPLEKESFLPKEDSKAFTGEVITFYVIADEDGLEHFKTEIKKHLKGNTYNLTKERTGIYEKFVLREKALPIDRPDFWLSVDRYVGSSEVKPVIAFTTDRDLAINFFLYFTARPFLEKAFTDYTPKIFDKVRYGKVIYSVAGINEDGTFTLKFKHNKVKVPVNFIFPVNLKVDNVSLEVLQADLNKIYQRSGILSIAQTS